MTQPAENPCEHVGRVRDIFDRWADAGRAEGMERGHGPVARQAFARLDVRAGQRYLDIGCGNGYSVRWAAAVDPSVEAVGIDVSGRMIARARDLSADVPGARFEVATFPPADGAALGGPFDAIFSMEVFYYLPDIPAALAAVHDHLVPGGLLALTIDFYRENTASHAWPEDTGAPMTLWSAAEWASAIRDAGLEVLHQGRLLPPLAAGERASWKHTEGSLFNLARRPD